jgi:hypothetical protein
MANVLRREPVTDGICAALASTGYPVGDHGTKDVNDQPIDTTGRYSIVRSITGTADGSMAYPAEDGTLIYQVNSHGRSRKQCDWLADRNRDLLINRQVTVVGWTVTYVELRAAGTPTDVGIDDTGTSLWVCTEDFAISITAA